MNSPVKLWRNQRQMHTLLQKVGKLITWTIIRVPPEGYSSQAPYPVAVVELSDGKRIIAQVVDWEKEDLYKGKSVVTVLRRIAEASDDAIIPYGIKVKPV